MREPGDRGDMANTLNNLGNVLYEAGRLRFGAGIEPRRAWRSCGNWATEAGIATSLNNLGNVAREQGDFAAARALHEEGLAIRSGVGR